MQLITTIKSQDCTKSQLLFAIIIVGLSLSSPLPSHSQTSNRPIGSRNLIHNQAESATVANPGSLSHTLVAKCVQLDPSELNFGFIQPGQPPVEKLVRLTNTTNHMVRIVKTATNCTSISLEITEPDISPGDAIYVSVRHDCKQEIGTLVNSRIQFFFDGCTEETELRATGMIYESVIPRPKAIISIQPGPIAIELVAEDGIPFTIIKVIPPSLVTSLDQKPRQRQQLDISTSSLRIDPSIQSIQLHIDHPFVKLITIPVHQQMMSKHSATTSSITSNLRTSNSNDFKPNVPLQIVPRRISLGELQAEEQATLRLLIRRCLSHFSDSESVTIRSQTEVGSVSIVSVEQLNEDLYVVARFTHHSTLKHDTVIPLRISVGDKFGFASAYVIYRDDSTFTAIEDS